MEPLDKDMDDLLRKSAVHYPLKAGESGWDEVSARLMQIPVVNESPKRKNYKYYLLIVLAMMLLLLLGGLFYYNGRGTFQRKNSRIDETKLQRQEIISGKETGIKKTAAPNGLKRLVQKNKYTGSLNTIQLEFTGSSFAEPKYIMNTSEVKSFPVLLQYSIPEPPLQVTPITITSKHRNNFKGLYFGLNGGPELSKVGSQTIAKAGFHAGMLLGYRISTKLSVESGIMLGKRSYYSMGKYFSMSKIASSMPAGMEIITIDGQSSQLEIPLSLKYDFIRRPQSGLFFTAGVVSHVFLQEENHYQTMLNGVPANQMGMYKEDYFSLASELQISGGYEHTIGKSSRFRIEPYKKIPMKKSGMGSMPVFSSGVNVSVMYSIGK